jgi:hypothetical protein
MILEVADHNVDSSWYNRIRVTEDEGAMEQIEPEGFSQEFLAQV